VSAVVRACAEHRVNVIARGGGTSLEGQVLPLHRGWEERDGASATPFSRPTVVLAMDRMSAVLEVHARDLDARVQAGVGWQELQRALAPEGLIFPVDPGPGAQIGGMCGTGCSGTHAVRHGAMKANVLSLTAVAADGSVFSTGSRARKSVAGLDLTSLLIGSEGTLAIVCEAVLRLAAAPEATLVVATPFPSVRAACDAAARAVAGGLPLAAAELMDGPMCGAVRANTPALLPAGAVPTVLWKLAGSPAAVADAAARLRALADAAGGVGWAEADLASPEGGALWEARKTALFAAAAAHPGAQTLVTDVCVPLSALPALLERFEAHLAATTTAAAAAGGGAPAVYAVAHAGDGNAHHFVVFSPGQEAAAHALADWLAKAAIELGGTCTGEHGVGAGKLKHLLPELGLGNARVAGAIKAALDPGAILNPGKKIAPLGGFA
jgi:D-lactate dehydrogenase (cytochrome)